MKNGVALTLVLFLGCDSSEGSSTRQVAQSEVVVNTEPNTAVESTEPNAEAESAEPNMEAASGEQENVEAVAEPDIEGASAELDGEQENVELFDEEGEEGEVVPEPENRAQLNVALEAFLRATREFVGDGLRLQDLTQHGTTTVQRHDGSSVSVPIYTFAFELAEERTFYFGVGGAVTEIARVEEYPGLSTSFRVEGVSSAETHGETLALSLVTLESSTEHLNTGEPGEPSMERRFPVVRSTRLVVRPVSSEYIEPMESGLDEMAMEARVVARVEAAVGHDDEMDEDFHAEDLFQYQVEWNDQGQLRIVHQSGERVEHLARFSSWSDPFQM